MQHSLCLFSLRSGRRRHAKLLRLRSTAGLSLLAPNGRHRVTDRLGNLFPNSRADATESCLNQMGVALVGFTARLSLRGSYNPPLDCFWRSQPAGYRPSLRYPRLGATWRSAEIKTRWPLSLCCLRFNAPPSSTPDLGSRCSTAKICPVGANSMVLLRTLWWKGRS